MPAPAQCGDCKYCVDAVLYGQPRLECHRHPPEHVPDAHRRARQWKFPEVVEAQEPCGDFKSH